MTLRYRVCPDCGAMHDVSAWPDNHRFWNEALCAPNVISDTQAPTMSMGNGKLYDSKSEMRKHYKRDGLVEIGNDPGRFVPFKRPPADKKGIHEAVQKAAARVERGDVREQTKALMLTRPGRKAPKQPHADPKGPPTRTGVVRPTFH